jgi:hypothetical protein
MRSRGLKTARRIDALLNDTGALWEQVAKEVMCAHGVSAVDLRWARRESSKVEGREIVSRREALPFACDPAPWLSQTPTTCAMSTNDGAKSIIVREIFGIQF